MRIYKSGKGTELRGCEIFPFLFAAATSSESTEKGKTYTSEQEGHKAGRRLRFPTRPINATPAGTRDQA